jgi:hypothetical protein
MHYSTIVRYLNKGTKVGWCNYDPKIEHKRAMEKANFNCKKVICVTTNELFNSMAEASDYYDICKSSILKCCLNQRNKASKLKWRYYDELKDDFSSFLIS